MLRTGVVYHFLRSDPQRQRVLLVEFKPTAISAKPSGKAAPSKPPEALNRQPTRSASSRSDPSKRFRPNIHFVARHRFEQGLEDGLIVACVPQAELPPWFAGMTVEDLRNYAEHRQERKKSHDERIDRTLGHLWPLVENLNEVLAAEFPDALINAHARASIPKQNETRLRRAFYAYICFGCSRWALHYVAHQIGKWDRMGRNHKFGRPSRIHGAHHGYGTNDGEMIEQILEGYRKFSGPGEHISRIYRRTVTSIFGCVTQTDAAGRKSYLHPTGGPFPSLGQFRYRVAEVFPLEVRQNYKFGHARVRNSITHSQGRYAESVGNLMERTEQDAYCCAHVAKGYLPGSHLPALWVVRTRCITSGMIVGIGFSVRSERASAYRMALFCEAIGKVRFCSLFGIDIPSEEWPSVGVAPHVINDRGPGSTRKADSADPIFRPAIKEAAPSYSGQSKASVETTHPKLVALEGKPYFLETRLSIPQLAVQEIMRAISDNNSLDIADRLNNEALQERVFATPTALWQYLDKKGRNHAVSVGFEEAVRAYLTPIEVTVRDDAVYFFDARFDSEALKCSGALQKAHNLGRYTLNGYMLDVCVRHLWVDLGTRLVEVDAMLSIRDGQEQLFISVLEIEQLQQIRSDARLELKSHSLAAKSHYEAESPRLL